MRQFRSVLAYVDTRNNSMAAVQTAVDVAKRGASRVLAMRVVDLDLAPLSPHLGGNDWENYLLRVALVEQRALQAKVEAYRATVPVSAQVRVGKPSLELIREVMAAGHDLVIKVASGTANQQRVAFGSTGMHLVRKCPAPVWLTPADATPPRRILCAVNPGPEGDEERRRLSCKIVAHGLALARHFDARLDIVHALRPSSYAAVGHPQVVEGRASISRRLESLADTVIRESGLGFAGVRVQVLDGEPEIAISELAMDGLATLIVLGAIGRPGIAGLLIGELSEDILLRVRCGVFCVKPDGFVSPLLGLATPTYEPRQLSEEA
ncbi:MAG TPA: universal stress protein [Polyangiaceae bacterium]|nr:universal stress protein [Polyangiaceae bacterium]